jgi:hypothetical protein
MFMFDLLSRRSPLHLSTLLAATLCACATPTGSSGGVAGEDCTARASSATNAARSLDALMTDRLANEPAAERAAFDAVTASRSEACVGEPGFDEADAALETHGPYFERTEEQARECAELEALVADKLPEYLSGRSYDEAESSDRGGHPQAPAIAARYNALPHCSAEVRRAVEVMAADREAFCQAAKCLPTGEAPPAAEGSVKE